jgi:hypothetical protein
MSCPFFARTAFRPAPRTIVREHILQLNHAIRHHRRFEPYRFES